MDTEADQRTGGGVEASRATRISGTLVARTATGPIFRSRLAFSLIPMSSALSTLQELALRSEHPGRPVLSSLASRVEGDRAYDAWFKLSAQVSAQIVVVPIAARVAYLRAVLKRAQRSGGSPGLEAVACSALNACWMHLAREETEFALRVVARLARSEFAARRSVVVVDPVMRGITLFGPGRLAAVDIDEWRAGWMAASTGDWSRPTRTELGALAGKDRDLGAIARGEDVDSGFNDLAAGLLGYRPGYKHVPSLEAGRERADPAQQRADELLGRGPGGKNAGLWGSMPGSDGASDGWQGALSDLLGSGPGRFGPNGFEGATPGSPYAPTGYLGPQGAMGDYGDFMIWAGKVMQGAGAVAAGAAVGAAVTGPSAMASPGLAIDGLILIGLGAALEIHGNNTNAKEAAEERSTADGKQIPTVAPVPTGSAAGTQTITVPPVVITGGSRSTISVPPVVIEDDTPVPDDVPDDEPRPGDLYPDPDGGGGGDPTQLWDDEGGGGTPNSIWDENGGGGTPNSIWDENGGGGTPNTTWDENFGGVGPKTRPIATVVSPSLVGPGLLAQFVQVGRRTIIY